MSSTLAFFRANPGAMAMATLLVLGTFVFGLIAFIMVRSGASPRPIVFVAGLFAIVVVPQALFHFSQALGWIPKESLTWVPRSENDSPWRAREALLVVKDGRFQQPQAIYGSSVDADLISDLKTRMPDVFGTANAAEMAILKNAESVVLAQFNAEQDAQQAAIGYTTAMLGAAPAIGEDGTRTIQRVNDAIKVLVAGRTMVAYSAQDVNAAATSLKKSPIVERASVGKSDALPVKKFWLYRQSTLIPIMLLLVLCATTWFFRVSAWSSEVQPAPGSEPVASGTLRERLLAVNNLDVPYSVEVSPDDSSTVVVTWRYADAKWLDMARAHGIKRTHRMLMRLDDKHATVRPTEQMSMMDWDAGRTGGAVRWATQMGIVLFQYEQQRVFGLQLDSNNRFTPKLSYSYKFNLQELKAPFIQAVTQSGWKWRPTIMRGPPWLAWLTQ